MVEPVVELLWWEGCPSTEPARKVLRQALDDGGLRSVAIRMVEVGSDERAQELGFRGSPTIWIDGVDVVVLAGAEDPSAGEPAALACRLYRRRDGRISPTPDPDDLSDAIARVVQRGQAGEEVA